MGSYDFNSFQTVELVEDAFSARHGEKVVEPLPGHEPNKLYPGSGLFWVVEVVMSAHIDRGGNLTYNLIRGGQGYAPRGNFRNLVSPDAGHA